MQNAFWGIRTLAYECIVHLKCNPLDQLGQECCVFFILFLFAAMLTGWFCMLVIPFIYLNQKTGTFATNIDITVLA